MKTKKAIFIVCIVILLAIISFALYKYIVLQNYRNQEKISIRGVIQSVNTGTYKGEDIKYIFVKGNIQNDTTVDQASIRVDKNTIIENSKFEDLKVDDKLEVVFIGPVADSYPVQAYAGYIRVIK